MATRNLGQVSAIHIGVNEPQNKDLIWRDISQSPRLWKIWNSVDAVWEVVPSQTVANNFLNLGDTPVSYAGNGGKILKVKVNLSGIEFADETTYSSEIDIAIEKAILSDSDEFLLSDSGTVKKTKWSQIKSTLKTYFDTLYVSVSTVTNQLISNWNEAFSWGDHSQEGYLKTEIDPVFNSHPASSVVNSGDGTKYLSDDGSYSEVTSLPQNQLDALANSNNPSGLNPFATAEDLGKKSYTIDFMTQNAYSPDINMYSDGTITAIVTNNIDTIKLTYSGGVQVPINPVGVNILIEAGETLFWEITRTIENEPAALGIKLELL